MSEVQEYKRKSIVPGYLPDEPLGVCEGAVRNERILFERGANQTGAQLCKMHYANPHAEYNRRFVPAVIIVHINHCFPT